jgi:flagellar motor switch protein FliG
MNEEDRKKLKAIFNSWEELLNQRKELNGEINDLISEASDITKLKKTQIRKTFVFLKNQSESGEDELDGITSLAIEMKE